MTTAIRPDAPQVDPRIAPPPVAGDFGQPRLLVPAPAQARLQHLGWPKLARAHDGTLVVAMCAARFHGSHGEGCPAIARSTDGGATFEPLRVLHEFDDTTRYDHCGNVAIGTTTSGALVLLAMAYRDGDYNTVLGWRSDDSGVTWNAVHSVKLCGAGSVFGTIFALPGRGIAACGHLRIESNPTKGLWIAYSEDDGRTWGQPHVFTEDAYFEPAVVRSGDQLIGHFRHHGNHPDFAQGISTDGGQTWDIQTPGPIGSDDPEHMWLPSPCIVACRYDPHRLFSVSTERHKPRPRPGKLLLWTADTRTLQWQRVGTLATFPENDADMFEDFGYPWMVQLDETRWFIVFYHGENQGPNSIWGMAFEPGIAR